jgi:UDP-N-acetylmuramate dehydrogenase
MDIQFQEFHPLSGHTTFRIGGPARYFLEASSEAELVAALQWGRDRGLPWFVLGGGSNVLISDDGFPGVVVQLGGELGQYTVDENAGVVRAGGGVRLQKMCIDLARQGWPGFEFMSGIPGTVGGAVRINAGTKDGEMKDKFVRARLLGGDLQQREVTAADMRFTYRRSSIFEQPVVVLLASLRLGERTDPAVLRAKIRDIVEDRRRREPRIPRNCGSVFKKTPDGKSAGWYIERAGFKGRQVGDAMVAREHANWILNLGDARCRDVRELIREIQDAVRDRFEIELEREVMYVPEDLRA